MKNTITTILFVFLLSLTSVFAQTVDVVPNSPNTNDNLLCNLAGGYIPGSYVWEVSAPGGSPNQVSDLRSNTVPASRTVKGQTWTCKPMVDYGYGIVQPIGQDSVTISNTAPTLNSIPNAVVAVGTPFNYQVTANDIDLPNEVLTYSIVSSPLSSISISSTGMISFTPTSVGVYSVSVSVTDSNGATASRTFTVTANVPVNSPPYFTSTPVTNGVVGNLYTYDADATDPDGNVLTYSLVSAPAGMTIDPVTGIVSWTPSAPGTYNSITVGVTDGIVTVTQIFSITVSSTGGNLPPYFTSTPVTTGTVGVTYVYDVDAFDPDGDPLLYSMTGSPGFLGSGSLDPTTGLMLLTPTAPGTYSIDVYVTDSINGYVTQSYNLTISGTGGVLSVAASANQTSGNLPLSVSFSAVSSGGLGTVSYSWDFDGDLNLDSNNQNDVYTYLAPGTYFATVYVTDSFGNFAQDTVQIDVIGTGALAAFIQPDTTSGVAPLTVNFNSVVSGGTFPVTFAWDFNGDAIVDSVAGFGSFTYSTPGTYNAILTVTDSLGATSTDSVLITVFPQGPNMITTSCPNGEVDKSYTCDINAAGTGALTYSLVTKPVGMTINSATGVVSWKPSSDGSFSFRVRATDSNGLYIEKPYTINVVDNNVQDGDLVVSSIKFLEDDFNQGGIATAVVSISNEGDIDAKDLVVTMSIDDLGVTTSTSKFTVKDGDQESKTLTLELPNSLSQGDYLVKFTIKNKDISIVKYKQIFVDGNQVVVTGASNVLGSTQLNYQPSITSYQPVSSKPKTNWSGIWFMVIVLVLLFGLVVYLARRIMQDNKEDAVKFTALDEQF